MNSVGGLAETAREDIPGARNLVMLGFGMIRLSSKLEIDP